MATKRKRRRPNPRHTKLLRKNRKHYEALLAIGGGGCWICGREPSENRRLDMDHDHNLMFIRGLLCVRCNRALASWMTEEWLLAAADYLSRGMAYPSERL